MSSARSLSRHLAIAYIALLIYACLHPLGGWQASGLPMFDYLIAPWPKYFNQDDMVVNVIGYMPLGFTVLAALPWRWTWKRQIGVTVLIAFLLSFGLETLQGFLPSRTASNLDIAANVCGAFLGALAGALWARALFSPGRGLARWRERYITHGRIGDAGLVLVALWLLVQLMPGHLLFGGGELRRLFGIAPPLPFDAGRLIVFEAAQTASMMVAVGLFARCMLRLKGPILAGVLLALGVGAHMAACAICLIPPNPLIWMTPGVEYGLLAGGALFAIALCLPRVAQHALAGTGLLMATVLVNMMPESPYLQSGTPAIIMRANYSNFYGLCRLVAAVWPFAALAYLSVFGLLRGERLEEDGYGEPATTRL
ncbi:MAG: VanZ family protein [Azoarcus sp.]|nr:VanZ family protein [Azoarcus sp.]